MQINDVNSETMYSSVVDIFVLRGWFYLRNEAADAGEISEYEQTLTELAKQQNFARNFDRGMERLQNTCKQALEFLSSPESLYLVAEDEELGAKEAHMRDLAMEALFVLDNITSLHETLFSWDAAQKFDPENQWLEQAAALRNQALDKDGPSPYRLVPLNNHRRERLDMINPLFHSLFPWYEQEAELPESTLQVLIDRLADTPKDELPLTLDYLYREISENDPELAENIHSQASLANLLPRVFAEAHELRWLLTATEEADREPLPLEVIKAGLTASALHVVCDLILQKQHSLEWRFRAAFCGPCLTDERRLAIFKETRKILDQDLAEVRNSFALQQVNSCLCGRMPATEMAEVLFREWTGLLERKAEQLLVIGTVTVNSDALQNLLAMSDEDALQYARGLNSVDDVDPVEEDVPVARPFWEDIIKGLKSSFFPPSVALQTDGAMSGGEDTGSRIDLQPGYFILPLPDLQNNRLGDYYSLVNEHELVDNKNYSDLYRFLARAESSFYWRCLLKTGEELTITEIKEKNGLPVSVHSRFVPEIIPEPDVLLLAISFDQDKLKNGDLERAAQIIKGQSLESETGERDSGVIWFLYKNTRKEGK